MALTGSTYTAFPRNVDTNRDDLVDIGEDLLRFGADTGTVSWQVEREDPQVYIPLATAQWDLLPVNAYVTQGGFKYVKNKYWQYPGVDENGIWQAYSLHTRCKLNSLIIDPTAPDDETKNIKRVDVYRPRGNVVTFDFQWDTTNHCFKPEGHPMGVNRKRTYLLRATSSYDYSLEYDLEFDSGIIHHFGDFEDGRVIYVSHINGRYLYYYGMAGVQLNPLQTNQQSPRYAVTMTWTNGVISQIRYQDRVNGQGVVTVTVQYDADKRITGLSKSIQEFSASVSGDVISYGANGSEGSSTRTSTAGGVTLVRTIPATGSSPAGTLTQEFSLNANQLVTQITVTPSGGLADGAGPVTTEYTFGLGDGDTSDSWMPDRTDRFADNQSPTWNKVTRIVRTPTGEWDEFTYWNDGDFHTGWPKTHTTPFQDGATHVVDTYDYDNSQVGGNPANMSWLVERPRHIQTLTQDVETAGVFCQCGCQYTTLQQIRSHGAGWNDPGNLTTTIGLSTYGPPTVMGPAGGVSYSAATPDARMTLVTTRWGGSGNPRPVIDTTTSVINAFGYAESVQTIDSGATVASAVSTLHSYGFGRLAQHDLPRRSFQREPQLRDLGTDADAEHRWIGDRPGVRQRRPAVPGNVVPGRSRRWVETGNTHVHLGRSWEMQLPPRRKAWTAVTASPLPPGPAMTRLAGFAGPRMPKASPPVSGISRAQA